MDEELHLGKPGDDTSETADARGRALGAAQTPNVDTAPSKERIPAEAKSPEPRQDRADVSEFERRLKALLEEAYPIFMDRLKRAPFADRHRRLGHESDLAQSSLMAVIQQCRKKRSVPTNIVGYLVTTARHKAISDWKKRRDEPSLFADLERLRTTPGSRRGGRVVAPEDNKDTFDRRDETGPSADGEEHAPEHESRLDSEALTGSQGQEDDEAEQVEAPEGYIAAADEDQATANHELVRAAIEALPRRQREAIQIYMHHREERTITQMAAMMNPPIGPDGFEKNIERGMKRLRQALAPAGPARPNRARGGQVSGS